MVKNMKKVFFVFFTIIFLSYFSFSNHISADYTEDLQNIDTQISELNKQIENSKNSQKTLSNDILRMNNQIKKTALQINETETKIKQLGLDIDNLSSKINRLEDSLSHLSEVLLNRIIVTYKTKPENSWLYLFDSKGLTDFLNRYKYLQTAQNHDKKLLMEMEGTKKNYSDQKNLLEIKKMEVEKLKRQLENQKVLLAKQTKEKENLLEITKNNELEYQRLLSEAESRRAGILSFIKSQGGSGLLNNQTKCDDWGCYYNQRDSKWGMSYLDGSNSTIKEFGCNTSSLAMVLSHYKYNIDPYNIAKSDIFASGPFNNDLILCNENLSVNNIQFSRTCNWGKNLNIIDEELSNNRPVIVGLYYAKHFVVLKKKEGNDYLMNDPFLENGYDISFNSRYSKDNISQVDVIRIKK